MPSDLVNINHQSLSLQGRVVLKISRNVISGFYCVGFSCLAAEPEQENYEHSRSNAEDVSAVVDKK